MVNKDYTEDDFDEDTNNGHQNDSSVDTKTKRTRIDRIELSNTTSSSDKKTDREGEYAKNIGTGNHAKTNVIYYIVSTTLVIFGCITASLIIIHIFGYSVTDLVSDIKDLWMVFTPIITLGLGYLFGANKSEEAKIMNQSEVEK
ncbi:hypothetical protein OGW02_10425 [Citrobacter sp. Ce105]|uniref:hypothetical protein n=1 Tax=Citrobacter sp. Ce105 TaxID=2985041 RepID=UPI00257878A6|nr:hypothetical protein [Citrobacter sp. Ce105]MDM3290057.1 hypothetical protein [Citrobacter sp. Ce105]